MAFQIEENVTQGGGRPSTNKFSRPLPPSFNSPAEEAHHRQEQLVLAAYALARAGMEFYKPYVTARDVLDPKTIWVWPAGILPTSLTVGDLIHLDLNGKVLQAGKRGADYDAVNYALHAAIYLNRPEITGVAQSETPSIKGIAMTNEGLKMVTQDACTFHQAWGRLTTEQIVAAGVEPASIAESIRDKRVMFLGKKGGLAMSISFEGALAFLLRFESVSESQLLAEAAARGKGRSIVLVGEEEAAMSAKPISNPHHAWLLAAPHFKRERRDHVVALKV